MNPGARNYVVGWLLFCCLLTFCMIVLGGVTRLTQSGLSMVEWSPLMGIVPPIEEAEWMEVYQKYQAFPEYQIVNRGMTLAEFKYIFYVEYAHRVLGRLIGAAYLVPFLFFWLSGQLGRSLSLKLAVPFLLGGLQGLMGWYMVKSGLVDIPRVSPYRLTAHLMLAVLILGYMLWMAFDLTADPESSRKESTAKGFTTLVLTAVLLMIATGGFVAGTKAGFAFNTFPKMAGQWVPDGMWVLQPVWRNLFENIATVQFVHRSLALLLTILIVTLWIRVRVRGLDPLRFGSNFLLIALAVQVGLGISTVLYVVPVSIAAAHQGGAMILFSAALLTRHRAGGRSFAA